MRWELIGPVATFGLAIIVVVVGSSFFDHLDSFAARNAAACVGRRCAEAYPSLRAPRPPRNVRFTCGRDEAALAIDR